MKTTIQRHPFARVETVREKASGECANCGQPAKFRYGMHADGIATRPAMQRWVFCGRACQRSFNS